MFTHNCHVLLFVLFTACSIAVLLEEADNNGSENSGNEADDGDGTTPPHISQTEVGLKCLF